MARQALRLAADGTPFVPGAKGATLTGQVYAHLREALIQGRLRRGETISGRELAISIGLSKTPVAEAIRQLVRERALEITPSGTVRVPIFGPDEVREMWALMILLERRMVDAVIAKATGPDIAELDLILAALEDSKRRREGRKAETLVRSMTFRAYEVGALPQTRDFLMTLWAQLGCGAGWMGVSAGLRRAYGACEAGGDGPRRAILDLYVWSHAHGSTAGQGPDQTRARSNRGQIKQGLDQIGVRPATSLSVSGG